MTSRMTGWFADEDEESVGPFRWCPYLQIPGMIFQLEGIWFPTEDDCIEFITEDILKAGLLSGYSSNTDRQEDHGNDYLR